MRSLCNVRWLSLFAGLTVGAACADEAPALALAKLVADRPANEGRVGTMHFQLQTASGSVREREALMIHSEVGDVERIAIYFTAPAMIEETAFLTFGHDAGPDENWLYLPATDRVRRLPATDRGDYFMGTDMTFGDVSDDFSFGLADWEFATGTQEVRDGIPYPVLLGRAKTPDLGQEMGYAGFRALIDPESAFPIWVEYQDTEGEPLKQVTVEEVRPVGGAPTAMRFVIENLQTGHATRVHFTNMRYRPALDEAVFDPDALAYGIPDVD
ncbi:MAG: outer membrane lipoprotein-sorting protein [Pseudomonadota bacterium]